MAGIAIMRGQLVELKRINLALQENMREADAADTEAEIARTILFGLKVTKASCDAFIAILGEVTGPKGKAISAGYSGLQPTAELVGKLSAGAPVRGGDFVKALAAGGNAANKILNPKGQLNDVIELKKIQTDLLVDAINSDYDKLKKDMMNYGSKLGQMALNAAQQQTYGTVLRVGTKLIQTGQDYLKAYDEFKANDMSATFLAAKKTFELRQRQVQQSITALEQAIASCEKQLGSRGMARG